MSFDSIKDDVSEYLDSNLVVQNDPIVVIDPSDDWTNWRLELANQMFIEWQSSKQNEN